MTAGSRRRSAAPELVGSPTPRLAPPIPARSLANEYAKVAREIGIELYPWQLTAARYQNAIRPDGRWLFREVCQVVARQNGKTEQLVPMIVHRLRMGRRMMHTAQNRELPREVHSRVADLVGLVPGELPRKGGRVVMPRFASGQEEIRMRNGGHYRIVAPTRSGARGPANDDVIVDELRELTDFGFIAAAKPTLTASANPQITYLSNAGEDDSVVLNALRDRRELDPSLAYVEWSAAPELAPDDQAGWFAANPSIGHNRNQLDYLTAEFRTNQLQGTLGIFETEHLCRWVSAIRERLIAPFDWAACRADKPSRPVRPQLGVSMSPDGARASIAVAWRTGGAVSVELVDDITGDPIDTDQVGTVIRSTIAKLGGSTGVGYDPLTDRELAKYAKVAKPVSGPEFANATAQFVNLVTARTLAWSNADQVSSDLTWCARKNDGGGSYHAVRMADDRPITAALAAIRAVWLASGPTPSSARVW